MTTATEKLNELSTSILDLKAKAAKQGQQLFSEACAEVFESLPNLVSFSWKQYAPYFNDGEPCEFSVWADYPDVVIKHEGKLVKLVGLWQTSYKGAAKGVSFDDSEFVDGTDDDEELERISEHLEQNSKDLVSILVALKPILHFLSANEEVAEEAFGNDSIVIVSRDGVEVEDYSGQHD